MLFYRLGDQPVEIGLEDLTEDMNLNFQVFYH